MGVTERKLAGERARYFAAWSRNIHMLSPAGSDRKRMPKPDFGTLPRWADHQDTPRRRYPWPIVRDRFHRWTNRRHASGTSLASMALSQIMPLPTNPLTAVPTLALSQMLERRRLSHAVRPENVQCRITFVSETMII